VDVPLPQINYENKNIKFKGRLYKTQFQNEYFKAQNWNVKWQIIWLTSTEKILWFRYRWQNLFLDFRCVLSESFEIIIN
jgi:hypothetical protein